MSKNSTRVALGGMSASLCLVLMFLTGLIPFATYALPAAAGIVLISVVIENGYPTAVMVYVAVSILSVFIVPDKEAAVMFIAIFGYYPILKGKLEKIKFRILEYLAKFGVFNVAVIAGYLFVIFALGIDDVMAEMNGVGKYAPLLLLGLANIMFIIYDYALTQVIGLYVEIIRPKILRKFK
ncbi:MAG: hypothetical protein RR263_00280 [Oscillospiraceae bacterium]